MFESVENCLKESAKYFKLLKIFIRGGEMMHDHEIFISYLHIKFT